MAEDKIFANAEMTGTAFEEGSALSLGTRFQVSAPCNAIRARYYCPASGPGGGGTVTAYLWRVGDVQLLATATFSAPTFGAWNEAPWQVGGVNTPVSLLTATIYSTSYSTPNRYVATPGYTGWPKTSAGGLLETLAPGGFFSSGTGVMPSATFNNGNYYADLVVETAGGGGTTPVTSGLDVRWQVRSQVASALDLRWQIRNAVTAAIDVRWAVRNAVTAALDARWTVRQSVTSLLDLRWSQRAEVVAPLDVRWAVLENEATSVTSALDVRWAVRNTVSSTLDAQWSVRAVVTSALDARWAVRNQVTAPLEALWIVRQRATGTLQLTWIVDGEVFVPQADVRAHLGTRVRSRPQIVTVRTIL